MNGVATEVSTMSFSDKIVITISQDGRLSQWVNPCLLRCSSSVAHLTLIAKVQVPLSAPSPALIDMALPGASALPSAHLTPKTLVGGGGEDRNTVGQLYAAQIASHLSLRNPEDRRTLLLGLGLERVETAREAFFDVLELVQQVV